MSDSDCSSFLLEPWTSTESKKRNKDLKRHKNDKNKLKNPNVCQKKKKKKKKDLKINESNEAGQRKKKKKKRPDLDHNDGVGVKDVHERQTTFSELQKHRSKQPKAKHLTQDPTKKKKMTVGFNLPIISAKRPKLLPRNAEEAEGEAGSSSRGHCQQYDNSQCNSDDLNSQDLFITQKMFRSSPPESTSSEASDTPHLAASPLLPQQRVEDTQENNEEAKTRSHFSPNCSKSIYKCVQAKEDKTFKKILTGDKLMLTSQKQLKCSLTKERKPQRPQYVKSAATNVYLNEPIVVDSLSDVANDKRSTSIQCLSPCIPHTNATTVVTTWTQTENFFTTELSLYLSFCQKSKSSVFPDEPKPLDLSLPNRERNNQRSCFTSQGIHEENKSTINSWSSDLTHDREEEEVGKGTLGEAETILSRFEAKSGDTTSSEENDSLIRLNKLDVAQVRAVQMRLNESFYFKTKGDPQSPRPDSPLMKLTQGRKVKSRKKSLSRKQEPV